MRPKPEAVSQSHQVLAISALWRSLSAAMASPHVLHIRCQCFELFLARFLSLRRVDKCSRKLGPASSLIADPRSQPLHRVLLFRAPYYGSGAIMAGEKSWSESLSLQA